MLENLSHAAEHLAGFVIVVIALSALWGITALVGRFFVGQAEKANRSAAHPATSAPAPAVGATSAPAPGEVPEEELAVIASAVALMLEHRHQIVSVRATPSRWGVQGRSDLHASHRLR